MWPLCCDAVIQMCFANVDRVASSWMEMMHPPLAVLSQPPSKWLQISRSRHLSLLSLPVSFCRCDKKIQMQTKRNCPRRGVKMRSEGTYLPSLSCCLLSWWMEGRSWRGELFHTLPVKTDTSLPLIGAQERTGSICCQNQIIFCQQSRRGGQPHLSQPCGQIFTCALSFYRLIV